MGSSGSPAAPHSADQLRDSAVRLAAALDGAGLYKAAAYAAMVLDAISPSGPDPATGRRFDPGADVDLDFTLDEHGRVWMIREGDCYVIGPRSRVCAEMTRFLQSLE